MNIPNFADLFAPMEGWCTPEKAAHLYELVNARALEHTVSCVEIGVFGGRSLVAMAMAVKDAGAGFVVGIDPYTAQSAIEHNDNDVVLEWWGKLVDLETIYLGCQRFIHAYNLMHCCALLRTSSEHVSHLFPQIDVLHIDGNHSETTSVRDVRLYAPRVRAGGYIIFDDANWPSTQRAVEMLNFYADRLPDRSETYAVFRKKGAI